MPSPLTQVRMAGGGLFRKAGKLAADALAEKAVDTSRRAAMGLGPKEFTPPVDLPASLSGGVAPVSPAPGAAPSMSPLEFAAQKILNQEVSRRDVLKRIGSALANQAVPSPLKAASKELVGRSARATKADPEITLGAMNMMARAIHSGQPYNPNRLELIKDFAVPEGMGVKEYLQELRKDPKAYQTLMGDLDVMTGALRSRYADDLVPAADVGFQGDEFVRIGGAKTAQDKQRFLDNLIDASPATIARESRLWDIHQGDFPYTAAMRRFEDSAEDGAGVVPRVFEPGVGTPLWYQELPEEVKNSVAAQLTGVKYSSAINKLKKMFPQKPMNAEDAFQTTERTIKQFKTDALPLVENYGKLSPGDSKKLFDTLFKFYSTPRPNEIRRILPEAAGNLSDQEATALVNDFVTHLDPVTSRYLDTEMKTVPGFVDVFYPKGVE